MLPWQPPPPTLKSPAPAPDIHSVDIDTLALTQPRSVGVEHVALHANAQLGLVEKITTLGIPAVGRACILGNLIGRMAAPASELATWEWLQANSALGELLDVDFASLSHMRLYRASDLLMQHRDATESHVFGTMTNLFALQETVTLYDLTNTYVEGGADLNDKAQYGRNSRLDGLPLMRLMISLGAMFGGALTKICTWSLLTAPFYDPDLKRCTYLPYQFSYPFRHLQRQHFVAMLRHPYKGTPNLKYRVASVSVIHVLPPAPPFS